MSTHLGQTYVAAAATGGDWRELDIMDRIIDQDPRATPFFEMTGETDAMNTRHQWNVRGVKDRASLTTIEGSTLVGQEISTPSRVFNTCKIQTTGVEITRTSRRERHYGVSDIWEDQVSLYTYEHRGDTEFGLIRDVIQEGNASTIRIQDGLLAAITTNASDYAIATLTETFFLDGLEVAWQSVDAPVLDCLVNSKLKKVIDTFDASGGIRNMEIRTRDVVHSVMKYFSSFGEVDIHLSRDILNVVGTSATAEMVMFDRRQMKRAYLDRTHMQPVAKTTDGDTMVIIDELCLEYGNEESGVKFTNLNAA